MQKKFGVPGLFCGCLFAGCMPAWAAEVTSQTDVSLRQVEHTISQSTSWPCCSSDSDS